MPNLEHSPELWRLNKQQWQDEYERGVTVVESRPAWIFLDPGAVCNLRCVQCPRENPGGGFVERRTDEIIADRVMDFLPYLERLTLYGLGEPLLSDLFWRFVEDDRTKFIPHIDVNTNGTLLSEKNVERLLASNLKFLKLSLDGATPNTFQKIRGGNLEKVLAGARRLLSRRRELGRSDFLMWVSMTLMVENICELPMMVDLACELGADALWAQHLHMTSDGSQDNWRLTRNGWTFVYNEQHLSNAPTLSNMMVRRAKQRADSRGFTFDLDPALWLKEPSAAPSRAEASPLPTTTHRPISECHQPWEQLFIDSRGEAAPCCFASRRVGDLREQTVDEIWNGPAMVRVRGAIRDGYVDRVCRHAGCRYVRDTEREFGVDAYDYRCGLDTEVSLRSGGRTDHCLAGWSEPEEWGVWSEGETATLVIDLAEKPALDLQLDVLCRGAGHANFPRSFVRVHANGYSIVRWEFCYPDSTEYSVWRTIRLPADTMSTNRLEIRFLVEKPLSPKLWGRDDGRLVGIGLSAFKLQHAV